MSLFIVAAGKAAVCGRMSLDGGVEVVSKTPIGQRVSCLTSAYSPRYMGSTDLDSIELSLSVSVKVYFETKRENKL